MSANDVIDRVNTKSPIVHELTFLRQQTGQDEATLFVKALHLGLNLLYQQTAEQVFIDGALPREEALTILGAEKVAKIEYLQQAFPQAIEKLEIYKQGESVPFVEDNHHEFKVVEKNQDPIESILEHRVEIDINAFLNTEGGVIYFGIDERSFVSGVQLNEQQRDLLIKEIDQLVGQFQPSVEKDLYKIRFVPIIGQGVEQDLYVVEIHVAKGLQSRKHHRYKTGARQSYLRENDKVIHALLELADVFKDDDMLPIIVAEAYKARGRAEDGQIENAPT
jgi:hypothetical protein